MTATDALYWLGFWHHLLGAACFVIGLVLAVICVVLSRISKSPFLKATIKVIGLSVVAVGTTYGIFRVDDVFNRNWVASGNSLPDYSLRRDKMSTRGHRPSEYQSGRDTAALIGLTPLWPLLGAITLMVLFEEEDVHRPKPRRFRKATKRGRKSDKPGTPSHTEKQLDDAQIKEAGMAEEERQKRAYVKAKRAKPFWTPERRKYVIAFVAFAAMLGVGKAVQVWMRGH